MKTLFLVLFSILLSISSDAQNKKSAGNQYCNAFAVEKITLGIDSDKVKIFHDTVRVVFVTITNNCKDCKIEGLIIAY